ncbi:MAG: type II toxin-antitoxin system HicB family antitoxin [Firmicutes bacterium]|nr:type II toxin-antitoxin system HicB family antitoxin [Bacillota bacterium]
MKVVYPTFIKQDKEWFLVYVPDLELYTEGKDFYDAIEMARDIIGLTCLSYEDDKVELPKPSDKANAIKIAKEDAKDGFDFSDGVLTYVDVDTVSYRNTIRKKSVKKNCTIPNWLNEKAEKEGLNFSRVLQNALIEIVGMD